ncbi:MAG: hypothetical protein WA061_02635 [Microgenomates group bacterium]
MVKLDKPWEDDDFVTLGVYPSGFYSYQDGMFKIMWERMKMAFYILIGKKYWLYELLLTKENVSDLKVAVDKIYEELRRSDGK